MTDLVIRPADKNKSSDLSKIVEFQLAMALESENLELDPTTVEKGVAKVASDYYLALDKSSGDIVGCLLVLNEWSDWRNGMVLWIHSVYVMPSFRRKGVYRALYSHLKEKVEQSHDLRGLRLYVDKTNTRAQKVYSDLGMNNQHYDLYEWMK